MDKRWTPLLKRPRRTDGSKANRKVKHKNKNQDAKLAGLQNAGMKIDERTDMISSYYKRRKKKKKIFSVKL